MQTGFLFCAKAAVPSLASSEAETLAPKLADSTPPPGLELEQLQEVWRRSILPAVESRWIPAWTVLAEAHPSALEGDTLTLEFPVESSFHRDRAEDPKSLTALKEALMYDIVEETQAAVA